MASYFPIQTYLHPVVNSHSMPEFMISIVCEFFFFFGIAEGNLMGDFCVTPFSFSIFFFSSFLLSSFSQSSAENSHSELELNK